MRTPTRLVAVALATAVAFALAACGSASNPVADKAKAAIKADILKNQTGNSIVGSKGFSATQAGCFSGKFVDGVGVNQLVKDGLITATGATKKSITSSNLQLPKADATTFVTSIFDCTDGGAPIMSTFRSKLDTTLASYTATQRTCVENKVTIDVIKSIFVAGLSGDTGAASTAFTTIAKGCGISH